MADFRAMFDAKFVFLAVFMVITGSINTISTKFADMTEAGGTWKNGKSHEFNHPFFQAAGMFLGELMCGAVYLFVVWWNAVPAGYRDPKAKSEDPNAPKLNPLLFALPAACDATATSLMYVGLTLTYASVFQMMRGAVVIFTGILSMIFLKRKLKLYHWLGMVLVMIGLGIVGLASIQGSSSNDARNPLVGDILVVAAQAVAAIQMVIEEKLLGKYSVPALKAVGLEGLFGLIIMVVCLIIFQFIPGPNPDRFENSIDAFVQMSNSVVIFICVIGTVLSIAFFNFFGISITKYASATTRMVIDTVRTVVIWVVFLAAGLQPFSVFQLIGYPILLLGIFVYNEVLKSFYPAFLSWPHGEDDHGHEKLDDEEN